jgi:hypothetical protein
MLAIAISRVATRSENCVWHASDRGMAASFLYFAVLDICAASDTAVTDAFCSARQQPH